MQHACTCMHACIYVFIRILTLFSLSQTANHVVPNRLKKEVAYYKKEALENKRIFEEMKEDATKDSYDIKRFQSVLNESYMMIPDSTRRLQQSADDLAEFLSQQQLQQQVDPAGEWYRTAEECLKEHHAATTATTASSEKSDKQDIPETTNVDDLAPDEAF